MKQYLQALNRCTLFEGIQAHDLEAMIGCLGAEVKDFKKKEIIFATTRIRR